MQVDASNSVLATLATADATQIVASYGLETGIARLGFASTAPGRSPACR
jgi:tetrahydromethanopterin S-methyltransferase subunit C